MAKAYRGVLKARISKLYGGEVTVAKAKALKNIKILSNHIGEYLIKPVDQ